jgi:hypothetical protein
MKSETGMRRAAVGVLRSPVHSYTAMARVTGVGDGALSVWGVERREQECGCEDEAAEDRPGVHACDLS